MEVKFWAATDVGRTRDHNEDNFLVDKKLNLFVVADGMGGHAAGEVASSVAVREVRKVMSSGREIIHAYAENETPAGREAILQLIEKAIETACARVFQLAEENAARKGMGTTLSLLLIAGHRGFVGHVGDSRIYLVRRGGVHQITEDHSLINELIKRGRLKPGDVFDSPYKNAVTRAVGVYETVEVDAFDIDILPKDNILLCSDGLSCYLDDELTRRHSTAEDVKTIPAALIRLANEKGGKDNITAIIVRVAQGNAPVEEARVTLVERKTTALQNQLLFRYLSYREIVKLLNLAERRSFSAGDVLATEGERSDLLQIILSGAVTLRRGAETVAELGPDDALGASCLIDDSPSDTAAVASEPTEVLVIRRVQLHGLMGNNSKLAAKLLWSLGQLLNTRVRMASAELMHADQTIRGLLNGDTGPAERPQLAPGLGAVTSMPVTVTDEVEPPFVTSEQEGQTDPLYAAPDSSKGAAANKPIGLEQTQPNLQAADLRGTSQSATPDDAQ